MAGASPGPEKWRTSFRSPPPLIAKVHRHAKHLAEGSFAPCCRKRSSRSSYESPPHDGTKTFAIGTQPNPLLRQTTDGLETDRHGCIITNGDDGLTTRPNVYAGGDAVTGAATVILAMGAGKRAASAIHRSLSK